MLVQETFDRVYFRDVVDAIFATSDKGTALAIIDEFSKFWMSIIGTRGATGKKTVNASQLCLIHYLKVKKSKNIT
jgi:hypothetical protein